MPDGQPDNSFGIEGRLTYGSWAQVQALALDRQGRLLVAGSGYRNGPPGSIDFQVSRRLADGSLDTGFGSNGFQNVDFGANGQDDHLSAMKVQSDGRILLAGSTTVSPQNRQFVVARLRPNGDLDPDFGFSGRGYGTFAPPQQTDNFDDMAVAIETGNGGIMVAGTGRAQSGERRFGIARLRLDLVFTDGFQP